MLNRLLAEKALEFCRSLACCSEEPDRITRTFLSAPMRDCHKLLSDWMEELGMTVQVDSFGNLRGVYPGTEEGPRLVIGSHLDTVPNAGAYDGILGVVLGIALIEGLEGARLGFDIEIVGFSEEEGVRFGFPFIGSRGYIGDLSPGDLSRTDAKGVSLRQAIREFGCEDSPAPSGDVFAFLEFHIEQGPILEGLDIGLGLVSAIVGQTRAQIAFHGRASHAGTTPMEMRQDALMAAAEWMTEVESLALARDCLTATVGKIEVSPSASNVIPGMATMSLDVRHLDDAVRDMAVDDMIVLANQIAERRNLSASYQLLVQNKTVLLDSNLQNIMERALDAAEQPYAEAVSGAGHDAMIMAKKWPSSMLFLRSPGGISRHPNETVLIEDVEAAIEVGLRLLEQLEAERS